MVIGKLHIFPKNLWSKGEENVQVQVKVDNQEVLKTKTATDPFCPVWDENIDFYKENANMLRFVGVSVRALCS